MDKPKTEQEVHEVLYDGADLLVTLLDGSTRMIKVRKIPRGEFSAFANAFGNEEKEAAFYISDAGKMPAVPVEQLSDESFDAVMQEGHRLNFTRFSNWFVRQYQRLKVIGPTLKDNAAIKTALALIAESDVLTKLGERTKN